VSLKVPYRAIEDPVKLRRVLEATLLLEANLDLPVLLQHVVAEACAMTNARYGALGVLNKDRDGLSAFVTHGLEPEIQARIGDLPTGHGVLGLLINDDPRPIRLTDLTAHPESSGFPPHHPPMTSFLGVPIKIRGEVYGNLYLTEKIGWSEFSADDEALVIALAISAGVAIQNARLHERAQEAAIYEDRDRLARDLHDTVIQRLFGVGLSLQSIAGGAPTPALSERLSGVVSDIDDVIRQIRSAIYQLAAESGQHTVRSRILSLVHNLSPLVGFEIPVTLNGPIDTALDSAVTEELLATIREAVTNIGRHAHATAATITLTASGTHCRLQVNDNGRGIDPTHIPEGGLGLGNLHRRAEKFSGALRIESPPAGGTSLTWEIPLS
jgi:signal transduction histidine kinase